MAAATEVVRPARERPIPWLLRGVNQQYRHSVAAKLKQAGFMDLPQPGYWALMSLATGARDAGQLIDEMGVSKQAVSKLADALVEAGFVDRKTNDLDRRKTDLLLTAKGRKAASIIMSAVRVTERTFVAELGRESFGQLRDMLEVLNQSRTAPASRSQRRP